MRMSNVRNPSSVEPRTCTAKIPTATLRNDDLTISALRAWVMRNPLLAWVQQEIRDPPLETILHLSPSRLKWLGVFSLVCHSLFWYLWAYLLPQPYENFGARLFLAITSLGLVYMQFKIARPSNWIHPYFSILCWLQAPVFFTWMLWMNGGNAVWLASLATMIVAYYHLTDWRLATIGIIAGGPVATLLAYWQLGALPAIPTADMVVLAFAWAAAVTLAISGASMRQERIDHSLVVIGVMAHELRTPLAAASLIAHAISAEAETPVDDHQSQRLEKLASNLESLTQAINHHIDLQMGNARLMQLPRVDQRILASGLVHAVVKGYPYSTLGEQQSVGVSVQQDFWFFGSEQQFCQVLNNLLKNALHALKVARPVLHQGDLRIALGLAAGIGRITVSDRGAGISPEHLSRIFEPFFSTGHDTGHGLGLAFCRQVVQNAGGVIGATSSPASGATFTIDLPAQPVAPSDDHGGQKTLAFDA
jgi:two-component system, CAI-1 autoinducer sensor kinase/phosphatase CqsS